LSSNVKTKILKLISTDSRLDATARGDSVRISGWTLPRQKLGWWGYPIVKTAWS